MTRDEQRTASTGRRSSTTRRSLPHGTFSEPDWSRNTGPVDFPRLVRIAAIAGLPVARYHRGRFTFWRDGQQVPAL